MAKIRLTEAQFKAYCRKLLNEKRSKDYAKKIINEMFEKSVYCTEYCYELETGEINQYFSDEIQEFNSLEKAKTAAIYGAKNAWEQYDNLIPIEVVENGEEDTAYVSQNAIIARCGENAENIINAIKEFFENKVVLV